MSAFELSKWYADCTDERGNAVILYHAELHWHSVTLHYSSLLERSADTRVRTRFSLLPKPAPQRTRDGIDWRSAKWKATGAWRQLGTRHKETLYASGDGSLNWNCHAPRAVATVQIGSGAIEGWGYAEHLLLTIPPWQLPIRRLRWGRFVNAADALVWIDWEGSHSTRVVYLNGNPVAATEIDDNRIVLKNPQATLQLQDKSVIREGPVGSTALSVVPGIDRILPASMLTLRECKWLSRAVLRRCGSPDSIGMAIHEVVEWP